MTSRASRQSGGDNHQPEFMAVRLSRPDPSQRSLPTDRWLVYTRSPRHRGNCLSSRYSSFTGHFFSATP